MKPGETSHEPLAGTAIHGFRIERKIGEGGMGKVFVARHESLPIFKVVKVLLPEYSRNKQIRARFLREAKAVASMDHPHVITVDNFGELPSGELFLMMPLLSGRALDDYLRSAGKLGVHHALQIAAQVGSALQHAHARGIVHRDLKPGNVFVERKSGRDVVKLLDFGIAKEVNVTAGVDVNATANMRATGSPRRTAGARTKTGMSLGTPSYMACEQYDNASAVTSTADTFALAVVIVEMLTGELPWGIHDDHILYFRQKTEAPVFGPEVPRAWLPVLSAALSPDPTRRPPSVRLFVLGLAERLTALPPIWSDGIQIIAEVAPDLIQHAMPTDATVRSSSNGSARPAQVPLPEHAKTPSPTTLSSASGASEVRAGPRRKSRLLALITVLVICAGIVGALVSYLTDSRGNREVAGADEGHPRTAAPSVADANMTARPTADAFSALDAATADASASVDAAIVVDAGIHRPWSEPRRRQESVPAGSAAPPAPPDAALTSPLPAEEAKQNPNVLRLEVQPKGGNLVASSSSCGDEALTALWTIVRQAPRVEIGEGAITMTINGKPRAASRIAGSGSYTVGFFDLEDHSTLAITVPRQEAGDPSFETEIARFVRPSDRTTACVDKWRGRSRKVEP